MSSGRQTVGAWMASRALRVVMTLLLGSCRYRVVHRERLEEAIAAGGPTVLAAWHEALVLVLGSFPRTLLARGIPLTVLISRSRDGDLGAYLSEAVGAHVVRGSTSRGGGAALRSLVRRVGRGDWPVLIPDGPRGPVREAKEGTVALARLTRTAVLPMGLAVDREWRLRSWDRTRIPRPGARICLAPGRLWRPDEASSGSLADLSQELGARLDAAFLEAREALSAGG